MNELPQPPKLSPSAVAGVSHYNAGIQWYGCSLPGQWGQAPQWQLDLINSMSRDMKRNVRGWITLPTLNNIREPGPRRILCGGTNFAHFIRLLCVYFRLFQNKKYNNYYAKLKWETGRRGFKTVSGEHPSQLCCHLKIFPGWRQRIPTASWWQPAPGGTWRSWKVSRLYTSRYLDCR